MTPAIAVAPEPPTQHVVDAVVEAGGRVVPLAEADALVWTESAAPEALAGALARAPQLRWVQLPWAGVEPYVGVMDTEWVWTCAKGAYAEPVAEHALALALAGLRHLPVRARATTWGKSAGRSLFDRPVTIVGGGGIAQVLVDLLAPFRCEVTVVRRRSAAMAGVRRTLTAERLPESLPGAAVVFLALALTPATRHLIGREELALMNERAWLVNVARGGHVDTDALVQALQDGTIGGAALDVTDPEPLPDGHPLWTMSNCMITPHTADTPAMVRRLFAARVHENVRRFAVGEPLIGVVDLDAGY